VSFINLHTVIVRVVVITKRYLSYIKYIKTERMINAVNNIVMALKKDQQVKSTGQTSLASIKIISGILSEEKTLF